MSHSTASHCMVSCCNFKVQHGICHVAVLDHVKAADNNKHPDILVPENFRHHDASSASVALTIIMVSAILLVQDKNEAEDGELSSHMVVLVPEQEGSQQHVPASHSQVSKGYAVCSTLIGALPDSCHNGDSADLFACSLSLPMLQPSQSCISRPSCCARLVPCVL